MIQELVSPAAVWRKNIRQLSRRNFPETSVFTDVAVRTSDISI